MWTATIKTIKKQAGEVHITVELTNGTETVGKVFKLSTVQNLKSLIQAEIARIDSLYTLADTVKEGSVDLTPDPIPSSTPTDPAREAFKVKVQEYYRAVELEKAGIITSSQLLAIKTALKQAYKPEYADFF